MASSMTTTYFGHRINIERFEWGYLAEVVEPGSGRHWIAVYSSALQALENAFEAIDESLKRANVEDSVGGNERPFLEGRPAAAALGNDPVAGRASTKEHGDVGL
jgi:hypothetical protein